MSVSDRALREIYLKPFEMAIKEGKNVLVMTSYNKVNGFYCASNYDLTSTILRGEWNFDGIVMTDWWANCNVERYRGGDKESLQAMIKSENDVYMVCKDSRVKSASIMRRIKEGYITLGQLQKCVVNICKWIMSTNTFCSYVKAGCKSKYPITVNVDNLTEVCRIDSPKSDTDYDIDIKSGKYTALVVTLCYESEPLAQFTLDIKLDDVSFPVILGADSGKRVKEVRVTDSAWKNVHKLRISYPSVLKIESIVIKQ